MTEPELAPVVIRELPLAMFDRSRQHVEALLREFAIIAEGADEPDVPARLLRLIDDLRVEYSAFTLGAEQEIDAALERGEPSIDVEYRLPPGAAEAARSLRQMLDEADEYCRHGDLLTLAAPRQLRAFRHWLLGEVVRQLEGQPPRAWSEWSASDTR